MTNIPDFTDVDIALATTLSDIAIVQAAYRQNHGKYQQMETVPGPEGTNFSVSEYVSPLGVGYAVEISKMIEGEEWRRVFGFGPEERDTVWFRVSG